MIMKPAVHKQGHPQHPEGRCLHCEIGGLIMEHYYGGRPMDDVFMEVVEVLAVFLAGQPDVAREKMTTRVEQGFREMVFGGAAHEIRTLIMHEDGASH